jgi:hypothetical protein
MITFLENEKENNCAISKTAKTKENKGDVSKLENIS